LLCPRVRVHSLHCPCSCPCQLSCSSPYPFSRFNMNMDSKRSIQTSIIKIRDIGFLQYQTKKTLVRHKNFWYRNKTPNVGHYGHNIQCRCPATRISKNIVSSYKDIMWHAIMFCNVSHYVTYYFM
jgi:hypothetical protein